MGPLIVAALAIGAYFFFFPPTEQKVSYHNQVIGPEKNFTNGQVMTCPCKKWDPKEIDAYKNQQPSVF